MSVLPRSATFYSFFIVLAGLLLCTILLGLNLQKIFQSIKNWKIIPSASPPSEILRGRLAVLKFLRPLKYILYIFLLPLAWIGSYIDMLDAYNGMTPSQLYRYNYFDFPGADHWLLEIPLWLVAGLPVYILRRLVLPEICMPIDQYIMYNQVA